MDRENTNLFSLLPLLLKLLRIGFLIFIHTLDSIGFLLFLQQVFIDLEDNHRRKSGADQ
jgi:hypothetical protein